MRPHIVLQLAADVATPRLAHWRELIGHSGLRQRALNQSLHPTIDAALRRRGLLYWATREHLASGGSGWSREETQSGLDRIYRLILAKGTRWPSGLIEEIRLLPVVERARAAEVRGVEMPEARARSSGRPPSQWARDSIGLPRAHLACRGDPSVIVAVLDTGVCATHPELDHVLLPGFDFVDIIDGAAGFVGDHIGADAAPDDEQGHGTHVAGIIAAKGIRAPEGVAPLCKILPVRVLGTYVGKEGRPVGAGLRDNIDQGLKWAIDNGASVINMSLGLLAEGPGDRPHAAMMDYAKRKGVTVVAAVGNDGSTQRYYPSALPHVIAVGAYDRAGDVARFSTRGRQVDIIAPGEEIFSSYADDGYAFASGTSQAAPFVAGVVALLRSYALRSGSALGDQAIKHTLKRTADRPGQAQKTRDAGYGRLNAADALRFLQLQRPDPPTSIGRRRPPQFEARP